MTATTKSAVDDFANDPALRKYREEIEGDIEPELEILREDFAEAKRISDELGMSRAAREIQRLECRAAELGKHIRRRLVDLTNEKSQRTATLAALHGERKYLEGRIAVTNEQVKLHEAQGRRGNAETCREQAEVLTANLPEIDRSVAHEEERLAALSATPAARAEKRGRRTRGG